MKVFGGLRETVNFMDNCSTISGMNTNPLRPGLESS